LIATVDDPDTHAIPAALAESRAAGAGAAGRAAGEFPSPAAVLGA
jgi:hypothetical protein